MEYKSLCILENSSSAGKFTKNKLCHIAAAKLFYEQNRITTTEQNFSVTASIILLLITAKSLRFINTSLTYFLTLFSEAVARKCSIKFGEFS